MTEANVKKIMNAIEAYSDKEQLLGMSPEEATAALNAGGNHFDVADIVEVGKAVQYFNTHDGEMGEDELEAVSGGGNRAWMALTMLQGVCIAGGYLCLGAAAACMW